MADLGVVTELWSADWGAILTQLPAVVAMAIIVPLALLLNTGALEHAFQDGHRCRPRADGHWGRCGGRSPSGRDARLRIPRGHSPRTAHRWRQSDPAAGRGRSRCHGARPRCRCHQHRARLHPGRAVAGPRFRFHPDLGVGRSTPCRAPRIRPHHRHHRDRGDSRVPLGRCPWSHRSHRPLRGPLQPYSCGAVAIHGQRSEEQRTTQRGRRVHAHRGRRQDRPHRVAGLPVLRQDGADRPLSARDAGAAIGGRGPRRRLSPGHWDGLVGRGLVRSTDPVHRGPGDRGGVLRRQLPMC